MLDEQNYTQRKHEANEFLSKNRMTFHHKTQSTSENERQKMDCKK